MKDLPTEGVKSGYYDSVTGKSCPVLRLVDITEYSPFDTLAVLMFTEDRTGMLVSLIAPYNTGDMLLGSKVLYGISLIEEHIDAIEPTVLDASPTTGPTGLFWNYRYFASKVGLSPKGLFALIKKAAPVAVPA